MPEKVFLTDERRDVLEGQADHLTEQSLRNAKSRIRVRSRIALDELIEVAESDEIGNASIFQPDDVFRLLRALLTPSTDETTKDAGLIGPEDHTDEFRKYADRLHVTLDRFQRFRHSIDED